MSHARTQHPNARLTPRARRTSCSRFQVIGRDNPLGCEEFSSDGSDPSLGEGVGYGNPYWCAEDFEALGRERLVKCVDESATAVAEQRASTLEVLGVGHEQVAGGLGGPLTDRVAVVPA